MARIAAIGVMLVLAGCVAHSPPKISPTPPSVAMPTESGTSSYYDRDQDGLVDLELHELGCCDRDWALIDDDFSGRYDRLVRWSYSLMERPVDLPVATGVKVTAGQPSLSGWEK